MQCIVVKSDEFENSSPLYIFPLNPDYVAARSLRSLRSNNNILGLLPLLKLLKFPTRGPKVLVANSIVVGQMFLSQ